MQTDDSVKEVLKKKKKKETLKHTCRKLNRFAIWEKQQKCLFCIENA